MTDIEHLKKIMVSVTERLPEKGWYIVLNHDGRMFREYINAAGKWRSTSPSHFFDFSLLCKKSDAVKLIGQAMKSFFEYEDDCDPNKILVCATSRENIGERINSFITNNPL